MLGIIQNESLFKLYSFITYPYIERTCIILIMTIIQFNLNADHALKLKIIAF